ncbi:hypothetical protein M501DRAFT_1023261 [Patellaria atrata CBS 101060]|uniref:F-box domain-containing protein n=1 Tax=Patellaria atrata CBS 101060 TaxID=1346257 RepID=A0A9P4SFM5_9PEZI|nr:hypothetical protein M501DRAFT_1023261 [Patellaria atrata CBS 101060]
MATPIPFTPFRFFDLPSELRIRIYEYHLLTPDIIDLDPQNHKQILPRFNVFYACRRMHEEAFRVFYGGNTFRLFPTHGRFINTKWPLLSRMPARYRSAIHTIELCLGPGWNKPPQGWKIEPHLGLEDMRSLKRLRIFIQMDPASSPVFSEFCISREYYTLFCVDLLSGIMSNADGIDLVKFEAFPSVDQYGPLMSALVEEIKTRGKLVKYGPFQGWVEGCLTMKGQFLVK